MLAQQMNPSSSSRCDEEERTTYRAVFAGGPQDTVTEVTDTWQLDRVVEEMATAKTIYLDTEATSVDAVMADPLLLQLYWGGARAAYVLDLPLFTSEDLSSLFETLTKKLIVGHNLNYDYTLLKSHYPAVVFGAVYDTQLAEQLLTGGEEDTKKNWLARVSLKSLTKKYLAHDLDKQERETFSTVTNPRLWRPTASQVAYAADDVFVLEPIMAAQLDQLVNQGLWRAALLRFGALVPLADTEMRGMRVDVAAWRQYLAALDEEKTVVETELRTLLTLNEHRYRQSEYATACAQKAIWETERADAETALRAYWDANEQTLRATYAGWGAFKTSWMRSWREQHPNPGVAHLDTSPINLSSHEQMKRAYEFLGLAVDSLDAKARERLLERMDLTPDQHTLVEKHTRYSTLNTITTRYGENLLAELDPFSRLHGHFNIGLTGTGRMSSENPNFQNFPKDDRIRRAFIADEGTVVLTADYSGQELAIAAALSQDPAMMRDINAGKDLYKELAVQVWGGTLDDVSKEQRQMAKAAVLGINYGQGPKGLVNRYGMPEDLAKALINGLRKRYRRLTQWSDEQVRFAEEHGYVVTASGARRRFPHAKEMGWKLGTEARNAPIQGTAADIIYRVIWRLQQVEQMGLVPLNFVHDEVVALAPADQPVASFVTLLEHEMEDAAYDLLPFTKYGVRFRVETHVAPYWSKDNTTIFSLPEAS